MGHACHCDGGYALVLVLFILLVIIGCCCWTLC